jgi:hypothetical protein
VPLLLLLLLLLVCTLWDGTRSGLLVAWVVVVTAVVVVMAVGAAVMLDVGMEVGVVSVGMDLTAGGAGTCVGGRKGEWQGGGRGTTLASALPRLAAWTVGCLASKLYFIRRT